jgi:hypothetical protein
MPRLSKGNERDLLWGAAAIADEIGLSRKAAYARLEAGQLPVTKVGDTWVASRQVLRDFLVGRMRTPGQQEPHQ